MVHSLVIQHPRQALRQAPQAVVVVAVVAAPVLFLLEARPVDLEWLLFVMQDLREAQVVQCPHRVDSLITHLLHPALILLDVLLL
jgi:hypothetical protein